MPIINQAIWFEKCCFNFRGKFTCWDLNFPPIDQKALEPTINNRTSNYHFCKPLGGKIITFRPLIWAEQIQGSISIFSGLLSLNKLTPALQKSTNYRHIGNALFHHSFWSVKYPCQTRVCADFHWSFWNRRMQIAMMMRIHKREREREREVQLIFLSKSLGTKPEWKCTVSVSLLVFILIDKGHKQAFKELPWVTIFYSSFLF